VVFVARDGAPTPGPFFRRRFVSRPSRLAVSRLSLAGALGLGLWSCLAGPGGSAPLPQRRIGDAVGNWAGSHRTWNGQECSALADGLKKAGFVIRPDEAISAKALQACRVFVIGEPPQAPTEAELADLKAWVRNGGRLVLLADSGFSGCAANNAILAALGSSLSFTMNGCHNTPLKGGNLASEGPPHALIGQTMNVTPGSEVVGGTELAGTSLRCEKVGNGFVYCFGDRLDHNSNIPANAPDCVNLRVFLNICSDGRLGTPK
jgi:hypothetical protein